MTEANNDNTLDALKAEPFSELPPSPKLNESMLAINHPHKLEKIKKCNYCNFVSKTKFGFMSHMVNKHREAYSKDFPGAKIWNITGRPPKSSKLPKIPVMPEYDAEEVKTERAGGGLSKENIVIPPIPKSVPPPSPKSYKKPTRITDDYDPDDVEEELSDDPVKSVYKAIPNRKPVNFTGRDLYMAELLINNGFARDLSEVNKKSLRLAFSLLNAGNLANTAGGTNAFGEPISEKVHDIPVEKILENIEKSEIRELQLEQLRAKLAGKIKGGKKMESSDLMMILALTGGFGGNKQQDDSITKALEIIKLIQPQQQQNNSMDVIKMVELIKNLNPPQQQQDWKQNLEIAKMMLESSKQNNNNNNVVEILKTINSKNQEDIARQMELQKIKEEHNQKIMDLKIKQLESELSKPHAEMDFEKLRGTIQVVKELNEEIGGAKEPTTFDYIESLGKNLSGPLTEILKAKNQQRSRSHPMPIKSTSLEEEEDEENNNTNSEEEAIRSHRARLRPLSPQPTPKQEDGISLIPYTPPEIGKKKALEYMG